MALGSYVRIRLLRIARHFASDRLTKLGDTDPKLLKDGNDDALVLSQKSHEEVQIVNEGIARPARQIDCFVQRFRRFYRKAVRIDHELP